MVECPVPSYVRVKLECFLESISGKVLESYAVTGLNACSRRAVFLQEICLVIGIQVPERRNLAYRCREETDSCSEVVIIMALSSYTA